MLLWLHLQMTPSNWYKLKYPHSLLPCHALFLATASWPPAPYLHLGRRCCPSRGWGRRGEHEAEAAMVVAVAVAVGRRGQEVASCMGWCLLLPEHKQGHARSLLLPEHKNWANAAVAPSPAVVSHQEQLPLFFLGIGSYMILLFKCFVVLYVNHVSLICCNGTYSVATILVGAVSPLQCSVARLSCSLVRKPSPPHRLPFGRPSP
jgi:hypothetical protein